MQVERHFVSVGARRVHYHRAGSGPVVVLFHASPCSAWEMRPVLELFATSFTVIALDTPGFGLSDRLAVEQPSIEAFADAAAETLTALGITQAAVYGRHTGASIAVEFAARHPTRCAMAMTWGFPIYSPAQQAEKLGSYLAPLVPSFDGAHLLWLWFRFRDQHVFWPWNQQDLAHRATRDVPDLAFLHRGVVALLEAGDDYRIGYATAFRHRGLAALPDLTVPVCFGNRRSDSIFATMDLYPPDAWTLEVPAEDLAAARAELAVLRRHPAEGTAPPPPPTAPIAGRSTTRYVTVGDAQILVRSVGDLTAAAPWLLLHHAPGSSALYDELVVALGHQGAAAMALDLPGHGLSEPIAGLGQTVRGWADAVLLTLDAMGIPAVRLYGHNGGAAVAAELALLAPARVVGLALDAPIALPAHERDALAPGWLAGVAPVAPQWDGGHLLRAWHMRRDMELWWPWHDRRQACARTTEPRIDPAGLTRILLEQMRQPEHFAAAWHAVLTYDLLKSLALGVPPCRLLAAETDVFARCLPAAQAMRPDAPTVRVADAAASRAAALLDQ